MSKPSKLSNFRLLHLAWKSARGIKGMCYGFEFWIAIITWVMTSPYWLYQSWWSQVIDILPSVLGFTLTGFAIFLGFGSDEFKRFLIRVGKGSTDDNPYISVGAAFTIFVFVQLIALMFALIVNALQFPTPLFLMQFREQIEVGNYIVGAIGYLLFVYSLALALRASMRIFRLSRWYVMHLKFNDQSKTNNDTEASK